MRSIRPLITSITTLALAVLAPLSSAATAPQPITLVVPFAAGGPTDKIAHAVADAVRRNNPGQVIVVENVGGGGGTLGAARVAKAPADGSTVLLHNIAIGAAPALYGQLPYEAIKDFEYLGMIEEVPMTLIGRPTLPDKFSDFRKWVQGQPVVRLAHAGIGSASHLCGMLIQSGLNRSMVEKAYTGNAPAMDDLIGGGVDLLCDVTSNAARKVQDGKVRAYGVTAPTRVESAAFRDVPSLGELGVRGTEITVWFGLSAPKGTPQLQLDRLNQLVRGVVADAQFIASQEALGAIVINDARLTPTVHKRFVSGQIEHWGSVIRDINARSKEARRGASVF